MLKDCSIINVKDFANTYFGKSTDAYDAAIIWLSKLSKHTFNDEQVFKLSNLKIDKEPIVYTDPHGQWWTGRYIGSLYLDGISVEIQPRFGMDFVANNIPLNNFIPVEVNASFITGFKFIRFLQALLWINMLTKAARHALPTVKVENKHISSIARGRIDVRGTIKSRVDDTSNITSISHSKDINNAATTSIVLAYIEIQRWFPNHNLQNWLPDVIKLRLQKMIDATSRHSSIPKIRDVKNIRLRAIAKAYIPLMKLSLDILKKKGIKEENSDENNRTILLDVAELWELFVLDSLKEAMSDSLEISHGTYESEEYLLTDASGEYHLGKLLPDFVFSSHGSAIAIADAKYKRLGDAPWMSPKRDDLYQMTSYLSRFSDSQFGDFYYPDWGERCDVENKNPWLLNSGQMVNFVVIPTTKEEAVKYLKNLHAEIWETHKIDLGSSTYD